MKKTCKNCKYRNEGYAIKKMEEKCELFPWMHHCSFLSDRKKKHKYIYQCGAETLSVTIKRKLFGKFFTEIRERVKDKLDLDIMVSDEFGCRFWTKNKRNKK